MRPIERVSPALGAVPTLYGGSPNTPSAGPSTEPQPMAMDRRTYLKSVAKDTQQQLPLILSAIRDSRPRISYLVNPQNVPALSPLQSSDPNFDTKVTVVPSDTLDAALALESGRKLLQHTDEHTVCVLNFANAKKIGGDWLNGSGAQEEQLCFRTSLSATLPPRFYPVRSDECIYTPRVWIIKESERKQFAPIPVNQPTSPPTISVISMAAAEHPAVVVSGADLRYADQAQRSLMQEKMRMVLRVAASNLHRRLVLGAIGCGAFGHPPGEVAECWKTVLTEAEFEGWFEAIVFAVFDRQGGENYMIFHSVLNNLEFEM